MVQRWWKHSTNLQETQFSRGGRHISSFDMIGKCWGSYSWKAGFPFPRAQAVTHTAPTHAYACVQTHAHSEHKLCISTYAHSWLEKWGYFRWSKRSPGSTERGRVCTKAVCVQTSEYYKSCKLHSTLPLYGSCPVLSHSLQNRHNMLSAIQGSGFSASLWLIFYDLENGSDWDMLRR